jgi:ATP-dependent RNA helicase RhlE
MPYNTSRRPRGGNNSGGPRRGSFGQGRPRFGGGGGKRNGKQFIDPSRFVNKAVAKADESPYQPTHRFVDFALGEQIQANIAKKGYEFPSAIQDQSIPHIIDGKDLIGLANTGTGKTAAFLLPLIEKLDRHAEQPTILIVAPTRELAQQINEQFREFAWDMRLFSTLVVGGMNIDRQIRDIRRRPHVVIGTPGRLKDLIERNVLKLDHIKALVLDEADRMLDMGFLPDIRRIVSLTPPDRQTLFFSATITPQIQNLVHEFLKDPITVSVRTSETSEHVEQSVVEAHDKQHKVELLTEMLSNDEYEKVLVFGETKFGVQRLSDHLSKAGIASTAIHGNKSQSQRMRALKQFSSSDVRVLVATDVAARGLDIPNVTHVINFDTPQNYEDYIHRIGRTGRGGARGAAHTFITR